MIIIDSSIWIEFFRQKSHRCKAEVMRLIDEETISMPYLVLAEVLMGAKKSDAQMLSATLSALPVCYPSQQTCQFVTDFIGIARRRGYVFGFADLLIAAIAREIHASIWTLDSDFLHMEKIGITRLHGWR